MALPQRHIAHDASRRAAISIPALPPDTGRSAAMRRRVRALVARRRNRRSESSPLQAGRPARPATWRIQLAIIMRPPVTDRRHATKADDHHGRPQRRYSRRVGKCLPTAERYSFVPESWLDGGRNWWAHFAFTRINIAPPFLRKKIEDLRKAGASMSLSVAYVPIGRSVR